MRVHPPGKQRDWHRRITDALTDERLRSLSSVRHRMKVLARAVLSGDTDRARRVARQILIDDEIGAFND